MIETNLIPPVFGIVGLIVAFIIFGLVLRYDEGEEKIKKIADAIHHGAMAFMRREYTMLALFAGVLLVILYFALGPETALSCRQDAGRVGVDGSKAVDLNAAALPRRRT